MPPSVPAVHSSRCQALAAAPFRVLHLGTASSIRSSSSLRLRRGLTSRSRGAPTARHQAPATGTLYIVCGRGLASYRRRPLTSNVRRHKEPVDVRRESMATCACLLRCTCRVDTWRLLRLWNRVGAPRLLGSVGRCRQCHPSHGRGNASEQRVPCHRLPTGDPMESRRKDACARLAGLRGGRLQLHAAELQMDQRAVGRVPTPKRSTSAAPPSYSDPLLTNCASWSRCLFRVHKWRHDWHGSHLDLHTHVRRRCRQRSRRYRRGHLRRNGPSQSGSVWQALSSHSSARVAWATRWYVHGTGAHSLHVRCSSACPPPSTLGSWRR